MQLIIAVQQAGIFVGHADQRQGQPRSLTMIESLRRAGIADATVLRGAAGIVAHPPLHTTTQLDLAGDRPVAVTFVASPDQVTQIVAQIALQLTALVEARAMGIAPVGWAGRLQALSRHQEDHGDVAE
jgi:PII-like signaling protein